MHWQWEEEVTELAASRDCFASTSVHARPARPSMTRTSRDKPDARRQETKSEASGSDTDKLDLDHDGHGRDRQRRAPNAAIRSPAPHARPGRQLARRGGPNNRQSRRPEHSGCPGHAWQSRHQADCPSRVAAHAQGRIADAPLRIHAHRSGDRDVHLGDHVRDRLSRAQPGDDRSRSAEHLAGRASPKSSAACASSRRTSRRSRRARRATRRATGNCRPPLAPTSRDNTLVTFSRTGWSNPAGIQRPAEERVRYRFVDGSLVRDHWLSVDPALNSRAAPARAADARQIGGNPLPRSRHAQLAQGLAAARPPPDRWSAARSTRLLLTRPLAIEFTVVFEDWGRVQRIFEIPT